jgi:hypothetical protein
MVTTPSASDGHRKPPRSSLFVNRHAPWPSCQMILIRSPPRPLKQKGLRRADRASSFPEPAVPGSGILDAYRYGRSQATPAHCRVSQSPAFQHIENPRQRLRVNLRIHPDASPVAKIDLDQSGPSRRHQSHPPIIPGRQLRGFPACVRRSNLHRRKAWPDLLNRSRLSTPGEHHARSYPIAASDFRHLGARYQRFLDDPCLVVLRPSSPPL